MALRYLLDTDTLSDLVRRPRSRVAARIEAEGEASVCTSIVVAAELRYGAARSGSDRLARRVDLILSALEVLALERPVDLEYARLRWHLTRRGTPIGPNVLLIAAQALCLGLIVVTGNVPELDRVPGLAVESWLAS